MLNNATDHPNAYVTKNLATINPEKADHPEKDAYMIQRTMGIWSEVFTGIDQKRIVRVAAVQHAWYDNTRRTDSPS